MDHCNLNCKGCSHFAPLVQGKLFYDLNRFESDLFGFSRLFSDVYEIRLMGGEPLLHPEVIGFINVTRRIFPKTRISIFTNGLLLERMSEKFWETCHTNHVKIKITNYPVPLDLHRIKQMGKTHLVKIKIPPKISSFTQFINIKGNSDPQKSFKNCRARFMCPFIRDGKIYSCAFAPHVHIFNQYFGQDIPVTEKDFLDISSDISPEDVFEFLRQPIPMCHYCRENGSSFLWSRSQNAFTEWISKEPDTGKHFWQMGKARAISIFHLIKQRIEVNWRK